jgi:hypothetical protein
LVFRVENRKKKEVVVDEVKKKPRPPPKASAATSKIDASKYEMSCHVKVLLMLTSLN